MQADEITALARFWSAVSYYIAAKDDPVEMRKRFWAVQYAMDTPLSRECSQRERARRLGMASHEGLTTRKYDALSTIKSLVS
jgi:hypothetical protein